MSVRISVITVTYNCVDTIEKTIKSVINQTYENVEYIIVDGASTDGTKEIIEKYLNHISVYISEPDSGIYEAMNKALKNSHGKLIEFLNGDDYYYNNDVLEEVAQAFLDHPQMDILVGKDAEGIASSVHRPAEYRSIYVDAIFPHQATFAKKSVFDEIGGFDEKYRICADRDWILRAWYRGYHFELIDKVFVYNRKGGVSFGSETPLEEYLIAVEYLEKTKNDDLLPYAAKRALRIYGDWYVQNFFLTKPYLIHRDVLWGTLLHGADDCIVYGRGQFGKLIADSLRSCGIGIKGFIERDKVFDPADHELDIDVVRYVDVPVIIASSVYNEDIYHGLLENGVMQNMIISFDDIRRRILEYYDHSDNLAEYVKSRTGLDVL